MRTKVKDQETNRTVLEHIMMCCSAGVSPGKTKLSNEGHPPAGLTLGAPPVSCKGIPPQHLPRQTKFAHQTSGQVILNKVFPGDLFSRISKIEVEISHRYICTQNGQISEILVIPGELALWKKR